MPALSDYLSDRDIDLVRTWRDESRLSNPKRRTENHKQSGGRNWRPFFWKEKLGTKTGAPIDQDALYSNAALGSAPALREYRPFEPNFLNSLDRGAVVFLGAQQAFPAMRQAQPKFTVVFIAGIGGQLSALLDLVLEEIAGFDHCATTTKAPLTGAWTL
jgi:hypothetical protein